MRTRRIFPAMALLTMVLSPLTPAHADQDDVSPEKARAARAAGLIRPLADLLKRIEARYLGLVIEAELHESGGQWVYEFELLPEDGHIFKVFLDASTGALSRTEGQVREKP